MENCINCNKEYTIRGMKLHRKKCDEVYTLIKKKEEKESKKIKILFSHEKNLNIGNYLPDDCIKIIYEYLLLVDKNISYYQLYNDINNVSFVCKNFYINKPNIYYMKDKIIMEINEKICRSWSMNIYGLNNDDLEYLDYKIVSRGWNGTMHLFDIIDVKELAYKKYGTEYDYKKYLINKTNMKLLSKKEKDNIYKKRKDLYEQLFEKYNYKNNTFLDKTYEYYFDYIKKGVPRIITIEYDIKNNIDKNTLKNNLITELNKRNINFYETKEVLYYINKIQKYNIDIVIESLNNRMIKEEKYKKLNKDEYSLFAYKFINDSDKDINILINIINNIDLVRTYMDYDKNILIEALTDEKSINLYLDNIIEKWCNKYKEHDLETFDFIQKLDNNIQNKIKTKFLIFEEEKKKILNKKLLREKIINDFQNNFNNKNILFCLCDNQGSINCVDYLCKKCCNNINCKRHRKFSI